MKHYYHCGRVNIRRIARIAEDTGVRLLAVHGRSRAQKFRGEARYDDIAEVKKTLSIPVIVNGDIDSPAKAKTLIERHGFDGVMIGRAAQGNPWLFAVIRRAIEPSFTTDLPAPAPLITAHTAALHALYGRQGLLIARKHLHSYGQTFQLPRTFRDAVNAAHNPAAQLALIPQWFPHE